MTPNSRDELLGMAERVEGATDGLYDLSQEVGAALGRQKVYQHPGSENPAHLLYCISLDAAMTLVPEGWHVMTLCEGPNIEPRPRNFAYDGTWSVELHATIKGLLHNLEYGSGATPALALTAACLRARAASVGRNAERHDPEEGRGPKDEHAVPEGQTPTPSRSSTIARKG